MDGGFHSAGTIIVDSDAVARTRTDQHGCSVCLAGPRHLHQRARQHRRVPVGIAKDAIENEAGHRGRRVARR